MLEARTCCNKFNMLSSSVIVLKWANEVIIGVCS